jgi:SpoVK/Ycf46/Vps4 family AAA+-type ATPase
LKSLGENLSRNVLNFYGPPGTGKTLSATAVAQQLNKPLLQVDYSQVESKWVGETEKNIQAMFQSATELGSVILLDEADSLVSKRAEGGSHQANFMNLARNVFMQELDKFQGVVILTTNLFANYDEALLRRVSQHIEFTLPDTNQRQLLFRQHIPPAVPLKDVDFYELARQSQTLSGGDIKVVCVEAMTMAVMNAPSLQEAALSMSELVNEINKVKAAKQIHSGSKTPMGIVS